MDGWIMLDQGRLMYLPLGPTPQLMWHGLKTPQNASQRPGLGNPRTTMGGLNGKIIGTYMFVQMCLFKGTYMGKSIIGSKSINDRFTGKPCLILKE